MDHVDGFRSMLTRRSSVLSWLLLVWLAATSGCEPAPKRVGATSLLLSVAASGDVVERVQSLRIRVATFSGKWSVRDTLMLKAKGLRWPVEVPLTPRDESALDDEVEIIAEALDAEGKALVQARLITRFVERKERAVDLWLAPCGAGLLGTLCEDDAACHGHACLTCLEGRCLPTPLTPPSMLRALDDARPARPDAGNLPPMDAGKDAATDDASMREAGATDGGTRDGYVADTSIPTQASTQIQAALAAADGTDLGLQIEGATVTYVIPGLGNDTPGFTVQADRTGPALFVAVDPASLSPVPARGDVVSFTVVTMSTATPVRQAVTISAFTRTEQGADLGRLTQNLTGATDVVSAGGSYDNELADVSGWITGAFEYSGVAFEEAAIETVGLVGDRNYRLRVPASLRAAIDLVTGCFFAVHRTPFGRYGATTQLVAYEVGDISLSKCPAPGVVSAVALSPTSVRVSLSRTIAASSVNPSGTGFSVDHGLMVTKASVAGRNIMLTTSSQVAGTTYTVTAAPNLKDLQGTPLGAANTAAFSAFVIPPIVRINELNASVQNGCDLIELRVIRGGSLNGVALQERIAGTLYRFPAIDVAKNDLLVLHVGSGKPACNPASATEETTGPAQQPSATFTNNYDTAYDFWSSDDNLTNTDNVITLYDATGAIADALVVASAATGMAGVDSERQAATVAAAGQWQVVGGGTPAGGFIDADFCANAVLDLDGTGVSATGPSIQRLADTDDNDKDDWNSGSITVQNPTFGARNLGQSPL